MICELLVAGTPPSAVPGNLQAASAYFTGAEASKLPRVDFVRHCRVVVQLLNETIAALHLGKSNIWHQLFTNGTSRRQNEFQNLIISVEEDGEIEKILDPVIVSSCIYGEDGTSESTVKAILEKVCTVF